MNGKRAKQIRRQLGLSIDLRRENREFERRVAEFHADRDERLTRSRASRRRAFALVGLAFFVLALAAAVIGSL